LAQVEWIKILTFIFEDDKIRLIRDMPEGDTLLVLWFQLLTLAGKKNDYGRIYLIKGVPYTDEELGKVLGRPVSILNLALQVFKKFKMIGVDKLGITYIINWEKHQFIEGMQRIKEQTRLRVKKYREESKKKLEEKPDKKPVSKNGNVTDRYGNGIDKIRVDKIRKEDKEREEVRNQVSASLKEKKPANDIEFDQELLTWYGIDEDIYDDWVKRFPNIDVPVELMKIREYFKNNPGKAKEIEKKFEGRMPIYINDWLERAVKYKLADNL